MVNKTLYKCIIIRYHYIGLDERQDYHVEDWQAYDDTYLYKALEKFWKEDSFDSIYLNRAEHKKDFEIFEVKYFNDEEEASIWKKDWWHKNYPILEESIV